MGMSTSYRVISFERTDMVEGPMSKPSTSEEQVSNNHSVEKEMAKTFLRKVNASADYGRKADIRLFADESEENRRSIYTGLKALGKLFKVSDVYETLTCLAEERGVEEVGLMAPIISLILEGSPAGVFLRKFDSKEALKDESIKAIALDKVLNLPI